MGSLWGDKIRPAWYRYYAQVWKDAILVFRRPLQTSALLLFIPLMLLITFQSEDGPFNSDNLPDSCGYQDNYHFHIKNLNVYSVALLALGPIGAAFIGTVFVIDEGRSGFWLVLLNNRKGTKSMRLAWWTVLSVLTLISCLVAGGVGKIHSRSFLHTLPYGVVVGSIFSYAVATMAGFHMFAALTCRFTRNSAFLVIVFLLLCGIYFITTLAGTLSDQTHTYLRPQNTTQTICQEWSQSQVCAEYFHCEVPLTMDNGDLFHGCWYEASGIDSFWKPKNSAQVVRLFVMFFFPSFHLSHMWRLLYGISMLQIDSSAFYQADWFYLSTRRLIQLARDLNGTVPYVDTTVSVEQSQNFFSSVGNMAVLGTSNCTSAPHFTVKKGGNIGDYPPSFGLSMAYLYFLTVFFMAITLVLDHLYIRFSRSKRRLNPIKGQVLPTGMALNNARLWYDKQGPERNETFVVLDGVNLEVANKELLALVGRNGAGKSSITRILAGTLCAKVQRDLPQTSFSCNGKLLQETCVGVCEQDGYLYAELSVSECLTFVALVRGVTPSSVRDVVHVWMKDLNMVAIENTLVRNLSGGMARRLSIGLATIGNPDLILLDEPTTAMDPINKRYVWQHIQKMKTSSIILLCSHDMEEVETLADRVAILNAGKVVAQGSPTELLGQFGSTVQFSLYIDPVNVSQVEHTIGCYFKPRFPHHNITVKTVSSGLAVLSFRETSATFDRQLFAESLNDLIDWMDNPLIKGYGISNTTLEEVFMEVVQSTYTKMSESNHPSSNAETNPSDGSDMAVDQLCDSASEEDIDSPRPPPPR